MASAAQLSKGNAPRRSILDLAPLELDCMNTLWPLGESTVRRIQQGLAPSKPRAYTTIMTIMDRLAHKGVVTRRKVGRAYLYRPNLTAEQARARAIAQVVKGFFDGSAAAMAMHLSGGTVASPGVSRAAQRESVGEPARAPASERPPTREREAQPQERPPARLDEILL